MKTNTLNQIVIIKNGLKTVLKVFSPLLRKASFSMVFITSVAFCQSTNCSSVITSTSPSNQKYLGSGVSFLLQIKNTGNATNTFTLVADNFSGFNENPDGSSSQTNTLMNNRLEDKNHNLLQGVISLAPGESLEFYIKLTVIDLSILDLWNGTKITATSPSCPDSISQITVFTYIPPKKQDGVGLNYNYFYSENIYNYTKPYYLLSEKKVLSHTHS